jgi:hypothetical protein
MSEVLTGIVFSGIQHIATILVGMASVYLGYRLFIELPRRREGETKLDLPGGVSIMLSRIGPGIFFALFGTGMIIYSINKPIEIKDIAEQVNSADGATTTKRHRTLTGLGQSGEAGVPQPVLASSVKRETVIGHLNRIAAEANASKSGSELLDTTIAVREAKLALMREIWKPDWGDYATFHRWVTEQFERDPSPDGTHDAVAYFRQGG